MATVSITPRKRRAKWAQGRTQYDDADLPLASQPIPAPTMSPKVQAVCERITKGVEALLEAIGDGRKLWLREELNATDRQALKEAAALVGQRLGKPVR